MRVSAIKATMEGKWYLLDGEEVKEEDIGSDPAFFIKRPSPKELRRMNRQAQKQLFTGRRKAKKDDADILQKLLLHHCVKEWKNLTNDKKGEDGLNVPGEDGEPEQQSMECTRENREYLDGLWSEFSEMWVGVATENRSAEEEMEDDETGN